MPSSPLRHRTLVPPPEGVEAILGPTNTGKTHVALERMVQYPTGMIGLPLRLLAREVYDRLTERVGEQQVALITGEERRHPPGARYLVCTVEAMPTTSRVDFVAVDEIQLAADKGRGHIFTDRLLNVRGERATLFLGSDSVAGVIRRVLPDARITTQPRFSKLTHGGFTKLGALPPRSAAVAFSADAVYALAERARRKHGGCAVVLGALSPRTRNAQVAMFQSGEVPVLVATDAIGMGLNLDIGHVAFAEGHKFDGERIRTLHLSELAQIAGRAGRYRTDGTFGTTEALGGLSEESIRAIEEHRIPSLRRLYWRATALDPSTLASFERSLRAGPDRELQATGVCFERRDGDDDELAFALLARHSEVRARATHPNAVSLLWEVCRTPNYRRQLPEQHAELLLRVYLRLIEHGTMAEGWVRRSMEALDRIDTAGPAPGDRSGPAEREDRPGQSGIDTLTQRLAWIRTWSYLSQRSDWVEGARDLQAYAMEVENRLSDALHAELQARFVDRRAVLSVPIESGGINGREVHIGGRVVGVLEGLGFKAFEVTLSPGVRAAAESGIASRVVELLADPAENFRLGADLCLHWRAEAVARLHAGPVATEPRLRLVRADWLKPSDRMQVERRLSAVLRDEINAVMAPLRAPAGMPGRAGSGVSYLLEAGLGTVALERVVDARSGLSDTERRSLAKAGIRFGAKWAYSTAMLESGGEARRILAAVAAGLEAVPEVGDGEVVRVVGPGTPQASGFWPLAGMIRWGDHAVRVDLYEQWTADVRHLARSGSFVAPAVLAERLGNPAAALTELGMMKSGALWGRGRR